MWLSKLFMSYAALFSSWFPASSSDCSTASAPPDVSRPEATTSVLPAQPALPSFKALEPPADPEEAAKTTLLALLRPSPFYPKM